MHENASFMKHEVANTQLLSPAIQIIVSPFILSNSEFEQGTRDFEQTKNQTPAQGWKQYTVVMICCTMAWPWAGNINLYDFTFFFKHAEFVNQQVCPKEIS